MTEGERAFYKRRIKEEMRRARAISCPETKELHLSWAQFFDARLHGQRLPTPPPLP